MGSVTLTLAHRFVLKSPAAVHNQQKWAAMELLEEYTLLVGCITRSGEAAGERIHVGLIAAKALDVHACTSTLLGRRIAKASLLQSISHDSHH